MMVAFWEWLGQGYEFGFAQELLRLIREGDEGYRSFIEETNRELPAIVGAQGVCGCLSGRQTLLGAMVGASPVLLVVPTGILGHIYRGSAAVSGMANCAHRLHEDVRAHFLQ